MCGGWGDGSGRERRVTKPKVLLVILLINKRMKAHHGRILRYVFPFLWRKKTSGSVLPTQNSVTYISRVVFWTRAKKEGGFGKFKRVDSGTGNHLKRSRTPIKRTKHAHTALSRSAAQPADHSRFVSPSICPFPFLFRYPPFFSSCCPSKVFLQIEKGERFSGCLALSLSLFCFWLAGSLVSAACFVFDRLLIRRLISYKAPCGPSLRPPPFPSPSFSWLSPSPLPSSLSRPPKSNGIAFSSPFRPRLLSQPLPRLCL